jgi:hypothetical protein
MKAIRVEREKKVPERKNAGLVRMNAIAIHKRAKTGELLKARI